MNWYAIKSANWFINMPMLITWLLKTHTMTFARHLTRLSSQCVVMITQLPLPPYQLNWTFCPCMQYWLIEPYSLTTHVLVNKYDCVPSVPFKGNGFLTIYMAVLPSQQNGRVVRACKGSVRTVNGQCMYAYALRPFSLSKGKGVGRRTWLGDAHF